MNKTVYEMPLIDLLPESVKNDPDVAMAAKAVDNGFWYLSQKSKGLTMLPNLDEQPEEILDHLAFYLHVDFYSSSLNLNEKRELIKRSVYVHRIKGTPKAVEEVADVFFENAKVYEWFQYGGDPYHFKISTDEDMKSESDIPKIFSLINSVKNKRSKLEGVFFKNDNGIYFRVVENETIRLHPIIKFPAGSAMPGHRYNYNLIVSEESAIGESEYNYSGNIITEGFYNLSPDYFNDDIKVNVTKELLITENSTGICGEFHSGEGAT